MGPRISACQSQNSAEVTAHQRRRRPGKRRRGQGRYTDHQQWQQPRAGTPPWHRLKYRIGREPIDTEASDASVLEFGCQKRFSADLAPDERLNFPPLQGLVGEPMQRRDLDCAVVECYTFICCARNRKLMKLDCA